MFLTLVATLGGLLFGYDTAVISGTVKYLDLNFVAPLGLSETAASSLLGFAVSSALIGCVLGGMVGGVVASALGRKRGLMIAAVLFIISAVGSAYPEMGFPEVIPAALLFLLVLGVPESPRWLIMKGREAKAVAILERINGAPEAEVEAQSIRRSLHGTVKAKLFSYGVGVIVIGMLLSVFQQFIGINVVLYYAPEIFRNMGMGTNAALAQTIIVGVINLSFTVLAIFTVDRFGRRPLMIIGSLGMAVSMVTLGMTFFLEQMGFLSLLAMLCYVASFAVSWGPICWVLLAEIFPNKIRSQAMALAVAAQWVANYLVSWTFPMMDKSTYLNGIFHHAFAYWIYALMAVLAALFMWRFVPETKGRPLEEMEKLFAEK